MPSKQTAPFGSWLSPITSASIVAGTVGLMQPHLLDGAIHWSESRPVEAGRRVFVRQNADASRSDLTPPHMNGRTRVHEYGGAPVLPLPNGAVTSNFSDQRLWLVDGASATPITPDLPEAVLRYADARHDGRRNRIVAVREDHRSDPSNPTNAIVAVSLDGESLADGGTVLIEGADFFSTPRISDDGMHLAWLQWDHPNMPWDGTELWTATIAADGSLANLLRVAGGKNESVFQPEWSPNGDLAFVSDRTGWWNLYLQTPVSTVALHPREAEFGVPQWVFGMATYGFLDADTILSTYTSKGAWHLATIDITTRTLTDIPTPFTFIEDLAVRDGQALFVAGAPDRHTAIIRYDHASGTLEPVVSESGEALPTGYLSVPIPVTFPTTGGNDAYGNFYPPVNADFAGLEGELPPLVVLSHGGPTGQTATNLDFTIQYWTSRGFAILDVDYGGSTGYGRAYRERLQGTWGVVDVDDCVNGALAMARDGHADGERLTIRGWSASGYTALAALTFRDVFKAGASHYGISELSIMAAETHKFESRYLDGLLGPWPEAKATYDERSPIFAVDQLNCPLILFQGLEDKVVPPNQAQMMYNAVKAKGLPVALVMFEGEQHGFRQAENIRRALDGELYFLSRVFGFTPAETIEPVEIANLD